MENARYGTVDWTWRRIGFRKSRKISAGKNPAGKSRAEIRPGNSPGNLANHILLSDWELAGHYTAQASCFAEKDSNPKWLMNAFEKRKQGDFCYIAKNPTIPLFS